MKHLLIIICVQKYIHFNVYVIGKQHCCSALSFPHSRNLAFYTRFSMLHSVNDDLASCGSVVGRYSSSGRTDYVISFIIFYQKGSSVNFFSQSSVEVHRSFKFSPYNFIDVAASVVNLFLYSSSELLSLLNSNCASHTVFVVCVSKVN